jgi:2-dehydro-3-deoxygalactonokinase
VVAAADWGTSHLRVWLLNGEGEPIAERRSNEGLSAAVTDGFPAVFERVLRSMDAPHDLPAVICGMAGAKQGWIEAPYVATPTTIAGIFDSAVAIPSTHRAIRLMPGIAQKKRDAPEVMRGEETQLAGAVAELAAESQLVCLPGTHSKWVQVEKGVVRGFASFLTGELYAVLSTSSILRHTIGRNNAVSHDSPTFASHFRDALVNPQDLTGRLFRLRAAELLYGMAPGDAAAALSGLLIGAEFASARPWERSPGAKVLLIASGRLGRLYAEALRIANCDVTAVDADQTVRAGLFAAARHHFRLRAAKAIRDSA